MKRARPIASRLLMSHGALALLVALGLLATLQGLLRMVGLVAVVRQDDLSGLDVEETVHRAAWAVEVAARHGRARCDLGSEDIARADLVKARDALDLVLATLHGHGEEARDGAVVTSATRYRDFAAKATAGDTCKTLRDPVVDRARIQLDEELTDAWVARLNELHVRIREDEDEARKIGTTSAALGFAVAMIAAVVAVVVTRTTAASVTKPIAALASAANRLGEGSFEPIEVLAGPREVRELGRDLERMRLRIQEIDELKQGFLANVSHELRTPLARLREALSLLGDGTLGELNPKQARVMALARRACEEEVRLVTTLLDLQRLRSGQPLKVAGETTVSAVVDAAIAAEREGAQRRDVTLRIGKTTKHALSADASLLERALANLLRNAVSVSSAGQEVLVDAEEAGTQVVVRVRDSGPGVPEEVRKGLFSPFAAAPVSGVERPFSLGLGLAFAREVARAHSGDLDLEHSDEHGSVFRLVLPSESSESSETAS